MKKALACSFAAACFCAAAAFAQPVTSYLSLGPGDFQPEIPNTTFTRNYYLETSAGFWVYPHLPSGALLTSIALDFCADNSGTGPYVGVGFLTRTGVESGGGFMNGQPISPGCTTATLTSFSSFTQKNSENRMAIHVLPSTPLKIAGMVIGYQLQISPAPATATFNDVPTSDFAFQYVEALAASGITGGCGGGKFCPDSPVTRRQMAIFIAKGLGLSWP